MKIAFHLGAPQTDNEQLTWSLRKDSALLRQNRIMLRRPSKYRRFINDTLENLQGDSVAPEARQNLLNTLIKQQEVERLILSNSHFLGAPSWMFNNGIFYQNAGRNISRLRNLFSDNPCELFLAIRDPATFVPEIFARQNVKDFEDFMDGIDPNSIRWSDVITSIQEKNPDCPITVWCNEDTPTIWSTIMSEVTGLDRKTRFAGELDILGKIMPPDSVGWVQKFVDDRPDLNDLQRREVKAAFLEKFVADDAVEEVIDLPGWTTKLVHELTESYDYDVEAIAALPGVTLITP